MNVVAEISELSLVGETEVEPEFRSVSVATNPTGTSGTSSCSTDTISFLESLRIVSGTVDLVLGGFTQVEELADALLKPDGIQEANELAGRC